MKCAEGGAVYLGTEVPSCSQEKEVQCEQVKKKVTCCMLEIDKACCPETEDKSCASETELVHFDFETIISFSNYDFSHLVHLIINIIYSDVFYISKISNNFQSGIPPPKLNKPVLSQIQSFLL
ncbi:hypothetical protein N9B89_03300 [Flavobacteriales bacterium]|nr:hypothetical protein [Flavobacteriales bacterium]